MPKVRNLGVAFAESTDITAIKHIADLHKRELGFVLRPALADSIDRRSVLLARIQNSGEPVGFVHFRHRRDRCTKIYQICVLPSCRRRGVAAELIGVLRHNAAENGQTMLILQCPEDLPANSFYRAMGFSDEGAVSGRKRRLIIWSLPLQHASRLVPEVRHGNGS